MGAHPERANCILTGNMSHTYYDNHAEDFIRQTIDVDMSALYRRFLACVPDGGSILDAGCGSGRDTKTFKLRGYKVSAFDRSEAMVRHATAYAEVEVRLGTFQDICDEAFYDGIWCCASLLHVPMVEFPDVLQRLTRALKPSGVLYMSYKYGEGERKVGQRLFTDHTEASLPACLTPKLKILELWKTRDARPSRSNEFWLNALLRHSALVGVAIPVPRNDSSSV